MRLIPHEFNGFLFQQASKVASSWQVPYDWTIQGIGTNAIERDQNYPTFASKGYSGDIKVIDVNFLDVGCSRDELVVAMDVLGENQHQLIANDEFGRSWYVNAVCVGLNEQETSENTASFGTVFEVDDPIWKRVELSTQTISVNGTGTGTIIPGGNQPALPIITVTPTVSGSGFSYQKFVQIINNSDNALNMYPLNLTGAGLATDALVGAGKMLANGDDLRVYVDGVEVKRWLQDMNTANTKIWINWTQPANSNMTLGTAIAATGDVAMVTMENNPTNVARMALIPVTGNVLIGSEIFTYTGIDVGLLQLTGCTRASRQTTAGAHSITDVVKFVTHDVWIYYGYASIPAYVVDDTYKPIIKLTSTNTSWIYEEFGDTSALRTGGWTSTVINADNASIYTGLQSVTGVNPYATMGAAISGDPVISANVYWKLYNPCGITTVTATGQKYRVQFFPMLTKLYKGNLPYYSGVQVWSESTPAATSTWEALDSHSAVALGATYNYLWFFNSDTDNGSTSVAYHEIDDMTLVIDSAKVPTITLAAEQSTININATFVNSATGYTMQISYVINPGNYLVINTKEKTIQLQDGSNLINILQNMPVRYDWFPLLPSVSNVIDITDAGQTTYKFDWEDRSL